jgi:hypothetical protein
MGIRKAIVGLVVIAALSGCASTRSFELESLETHDLRVLYSSNEAYLAPHVARSFENSLAFQRKTFAWSPWEPTTVTLTDLRDYGNAGASASPDNNVIVYIAPDSLTMETSPGSERMYMIANHELVHVATMDGWNQRDARWRAFFGGKPRPTEEHPETILYNYLTVPRMSVPRWYLEGSAVFMETWMSGGLGRAQGAYDEMVFRAMVRDDAHFYDPLGLESEGTAIDFQSLSNAYLYGTRFISYLMLEHSPQQVVQWLQRGKDSKAYYADQFAQVFGEPLDDAWSQWIVWEHAFQQANLDKVRQFPLTEARHLVPRALGSVSRSFVDEQDQALIGGFSYPGALSSVGMLSLKDGSMRRVAEIKGPMMYRVTSSAYDPAGKTFFYTTDNLDFRDLMAVDVRGGKPRRLLRDARIGDLAFDAADRSLWGLRHENGYVTLVRIPAPYTDWTQVHTWPYGEVPFELDVSADGRLLSMSVAEISGSKFLRIFDTADLLAGKVEPVGQFDFGQATPEGFVFTADGRYLYGSSYYTGISNIYRYELATGEVEAVSNAETGFFRPIPMADGSLIVQEYTGQGFVPARIDPVPLKDLSAIDFLGTRIADRHPIVKDWAVGSPAKVPLDSMIVRQGKYRPPHEMRLESAYPVIEGYRGGTALGWHADFTDPLRLYKLSLDASASTSADVPSDERLHARVDYSTLNWYATYWHNYADFYDLFGPVETSLQGDAFIGGYKRALVYDTPRHLDFDGSIAYYTGLDTVPGNQNVATSSDSLFAAKGGLKYTNFRTSQNGLDHEQGIGWSIDAVLLSAGGKTIPKLRAGFDAGIILPWAHSSLWLYNSAGVSGGDRSDSLANYYFGGFHNNYVDKGDPKRYRESDSLPGFEIDEVGGKSFAKSVLEWNLPPIRFAEVGTPGFYLGWIRPALFVGILTTDPAQAEFRRTVRDAGGQVDLRFYVLNRFPMTLSLGYAQGYADGGKVGDEWMVSLKIL